MTIEQPPPHPEDRVSDTDDAISSQLAERLSQVMADQGIPTRQQASVLSQLCGLSLSQARRKLRGASWSFGEVLTLSRHYGFSIDGLIGAAVTNAAVPMQEATFLTSDWQGPCQVRLGAQVRGDSTSTDLVAAGKGEDWYVGTMNQLAHHSLMGPYYRADHIVLAVPPASSPTRIAVVDDEVSASELLCEWFNAMGYEATAYTSGGGFLLGPWSDNDAFVIDFMLAGGDSSQALIEEIRRAKPDAPILLLTGKLRDGQASEATLATLLRTSNVRFFEKPVRPAVLAAAIDSWLDESIGKD